MNSENTRLSQPLCLLREIACVIPFFQVESIGSLSGSWLLCITGGQKFPTQVRAEREVDCGGGTKKKMPEEGNRKTGRGELQ